MSAISISCCILCAVQISAVYAAGGEAPIPEGSSWKALHEGGVVTGAARDGSAIILRGTGSGLAGEGGKAVLSHQTGQPMWQNQCSVTVKLTSLNGAGGNAEAGVRMETGPSDILFGPGTGMRLIYRSSGTLHCEAGIYTWGVHPPPGVTGLSLPLYLRVEWNSGGLTGLYSQDGITWTPVNGWIGEDESEFFDAGTTLPVTLPPAAYPALMVSSQGDAQPAEARFEDIYICGGDADENGIADGWEKAKFGRLIGAEAASDPDGDGMTMREEWQWRKEPAVHDAKPHLITAMQPDGKLLLTLAGYETGGWVGFYGTFQSAASPGGPWTDLPGWNIEPPAPPLYLPAWKIAPQPGRQFYRVKAGIPTDDPLPP